MKKFEFGDRVSVSEIAYIVRKHDKAWYVPQKGNYSYTNIEVDQQQRVFESPLFKGKKGRWLHEGDWPDINKSAIAFPCNLEGIVIGQETKYYGFSSPQSGGYDSYSGEWDYESGGFDYYGRISLYVVKNSLKGSAFYVPETSLKLLGVLIPWEDLERWRDAPSNTASAA